MEVLEGIVEEIKYKSEDTGYVVGKATFKKEIVTIVGTMPLLKEGQQIKVKGLWVNHD